VVIMVLSSTQSKAGELESWVGRMLGEYAQRPVSGPLDPRMSLRDDLAVESLALVSLVVRLGDELGVDAGDESLALEGLTTVGDLVALARRLEVRSRSLRDAPVASTT
jgi:acyl carrier protein